MHESTRSAHHCSGWTNLDDRRLGNATTWEQFRYPSKKLNT
jgi:hypothetical protein